MCLGRKLIVRGSQQTDKAQRGKQRVSITAQVAVWLCSSKRNECLYHFVVIHMLDAISKRIPTSSRDVIIEETHMKGEMRLK